MIRYARIFCKPFKVKDIPESFHSSMVYEEVIGMGYHPERIRSTDDPARTLLTSLPRVALEFQPRGDDEIESLRQSLRTGEWGDGKIFLFQVEDTIEF